jgi:hypothetical protein
MVATVIVAGALIAGCGGSSQGGSAAVSAAHAQAVKHTADRAVAKVTAVHVKKDHSRPTARR